FAVSHIGLLLGAALIPMTAFCQTKLAENPSASAQAGPISGAPLTLTLQDALERAKKNSRQLQGAMTDLGLAREDRVQSRAAFLPSVNYNMEYLYTQGNGLRRNEPIFITNNAVHEYLAQGAVHEDFSPRVFAEYSRRRA